MRILRALTLTAVGFWAGMAAAAAVVKRPVPSRGDAESDEVALVANFDGVALKRRAKSFRGGSMLSWFGGVAVDPREAQLAPDAHVNVHSLFGGIAIRVPVGWRIESRVRAFGGGVTIGAPDPESLVRPPSRSTYSLRSGESPWAPSPLTPRRPRASE